MEEVKRHEFALVVTETGTGAVCSQSVWRVVRESIRKNGQDKEEY